MTNTQKRKTFHAPGYEEQILLQCQNTQSNLHIQCNTYRNNTIILHRAKTNNPSICMEPEKTLNSQSSLGKENQSRRHHNPGLQAILQSCNHHDTMVLAQEQTLRSMEQNRNTEMEPQMYHQLIFDKN